MAVERLGAALRQIERLFAEGNISGMSDRQLLDLFIERRDADAFEVLVARYGPMVLSVCCGILRDPDAAEDAFQASFLVLVKEAGKIRGHKSLGGWLHRVARRVAVRAKKAAVRRRGCEREAGMMAPRTIAYEPTVSDELRCALHEEIERLPERYRLPLVLCELQGLTHVQAAGSLGWSERTLRRRLAEAHERLKARMGRSGLETDAAVLGAVFLREARTLLPLHLRKATVRAALALLDPATIGAVPTLAQSLSQEVLEMMFVQKLAVASAALLGAGVMAWAASGALVARGDDPGAVKAPVAQRNAPVPRLGRDAESGELGTAGTIRGRGRVLDAERKSSANVEIQVDFRKANFDNVALTLMGYRAEDLVKPTERGLLVRIPPNERDPVPIGFAPRGVALHGDFEIIVEYELLRYDKPPRNDWVAAGIVVDFWAPANRVLTVERMFGPDGSDHFTSNIMAGTNRAGRLSSKQAPTSSRAGRLSLERTGSTVRAYYTDGSNAFRLLRVEEMGTGDAMITRIGAETSSKAYGIGVLYKSISVKAEGFVDVTPQPVDSTSWSGPLVLSAVASCIALGGVAAWKLKRYRSHERKVR